MRQRTSCGARTRSPNNIQAECEKSRKNTISSQQPARSLPLPLTQSLTHSISPFLPSLQLAIPFPLSSFFLSSHPPPPPTHRPSERVLPAPLCFSLHLHHDCHNRSQQPRLRDGANIDKRHFYSPVFPIQCVREENRKSMSELKMRLIQGGEVVVICHVAPSFFSPCETSQAVPGYPLPPLAFLSLSLSLSLPLPSLHVLPIRVSSGLSMEWQVECSSTAKIASCI